MSQSTGWADCIALAMAPMGVITIIVSAIRVTGPRWLKAVVGRARENVAAAELEVMSSTSSEACELWNGKTRAVVRCPGATDNCEFICIYPTSMLDKRHKGNTLKRVQIMDIKNAKNRDKIGDSNHQETRTGTPPPDQKRNSLISPASDDTIIITRNTAHLAPNMTLNCSADGERWQMWACAVVGIIIQSGVLVFFGFLTKYKTLRFEKDGSPVETYAMPMAVVGTLILNLGILVCAHAVDESSKEEVFEVTDSSAAVAMVWLQKKTKVSEQDFDSAAIYPTMKRSRAYTSERTIDDDGSQKAKTQDKGWWLKFMSTMGAATSLLGFFVQFIGLRGMHWLATIAQLGAIIIMTILRAVVRRHLALGLMSHDLCDSTGFELEWFVSSFLNKGGISWIPQEHPQTQNADTDGKRTKASKFTFEIQTNDTEVVQSSNSSFRQRDATQSFLKVSTLQHPQGILDLRRHLGELSKWKGPASTEAIAVANAIEKTMNFVMPLLSQKKVEREFVWTIRVNYNWGQSENSNDRTPKNIGMNLRYSLNNGWIAPVDEIEAALSLWLHSMKEVQAPDKTQHDFPSGNDHWIRGSPAQQQRCLQVLGPSEDVLLRDLTWWMPKGLDGILAARVKDSDVMDDKKFPYTVKRERVGYSGRRCPTVKRNEKSWTKDLSYWDWKPAADLHRDTDEIMQERGNIVVQSQQKSPDSQEQPTPDVFQWLVIESQDPLKRFYAKELFSAFIWALATHLGESTISRQLQANIKPDNATGTDAWKSFSLENHELSRFIQSLTELNLWTEQEAWRSIIPPLSATDNLPGLNAVIEMAQNKATTLERDLAWGQAGSVYRWLFDISMPSSPTSHIYVKSTAIMLRFHQRLSSSDSPHSDKTYSEKGDELEEELAKVKGCLRRQEEQNHAVQGDLSLFFDIHQELQRLVENPDIHGLVEHHFDGMSYLSRPERRVYGTFQRPGDIFDRTRLHHAMRSKFIDYEELPGEEMKSQWGGFDYWREHSPRMHQEYIKCMEPVATELESLSLYPFWLVKGIASAILYPFQTLEYLLDNGADPNARDLDHWTPLYYACQPITLDGKTYTSRDCFRVNTLIANKANVNAKGLDGNTPLHCAAISGRSHLVRLLIDSGGNVKAANLEGRTPLHLAAMANDPTMVSLLVKNDCDINIKDQAGQTPLHLAAISGQLACITKLIENGARLDVVDNSQATPLYLAAMDDSPEAFKALLNTDTLRLSMTKAIDEENLDLISLLMDETDPDAWPLADKHGQTPFHEAASNSKLKSLDKIFEKARELQFDLEVVLKKNILGQTVIHVYRPDSVAIIVKHLKPSPELLRRLIETQDDEGCTSLLQAIKAGQKEVVSILIDEGANSRTSSNDKKNILHASLMLPPNHLQHVIQKIKEREGWAQTLSSMLEEEDGNGKTPLDLARMFPIRENEELLEKVLEECKRELRLQGI
ncbi:hypothetical protein ACHAPD_006501 [Fusarium lateritium]